MSQFEDNLIIIQESLDHLRDHFEQQEKTFLLGWFLKEDDRERYNLLATTAHVEDYGKAIMSWAALGDEYTSGEEETPNF